MKKTLWIPLLILAGLAVLSRPSGAGVNCGSEGLLCSDEERCCEHQVAVFVNGAASGPSYTEGKCLSKGQRCGEYWCGNRHCARSLFGTPTVCCVSSAPGMSSEYTCAYSEL